LDKPLHVALFGASGATGRAFVRAGLARGLRIRASCRSASVELPPAVEAIRGGLLDPVHVGDVIRGAQAVCCVFGPRPPSTDVFCAQATVRIVEAMKGAGVRRLVCQTGAMIGEDAPNWTLPFRLMARLFRRQRPAVAEDRLRQELEVKASGLDWTLVKPPRLTDGPGCGRVVAGGDLRIGLMSKIARADLADFLVSECVTPSYVEHAVYVTG
jgi:putative NADH-flavin reductase